MPRYFRPILGGLAAGVLFASLPVLTGPAQAQTKKHPKAQTAAAETDSGDKKPNILFIMTDDVAWMAPSIYHGGAWRPGKHPTSTASARKA